MSFLFGVILTALAILFLLTALALGASDRLDRPLRFVLPLAVVLLLGLVLLSQ